MVLHLNVPAQQRLKNLLETFLPSCTEEFESLLQRTRAQIMGSFPLFCLEDHWPSWIKPGDLDIFLCPKLPSLLQRDLHAFEQILDKCGYGPCVLGPAYDPFMQPNHGVPSMNVFTFIRGRAPNTFQVQVILYTGMSNSPTWHLQHMWAFDLSCCSVSYDGTSFHVTQDNLFPTTQASTIRRLNPSTTQRIEKYHQRGFTFVINPRRSTDDLIRSFPRVTDLVSLCALILSWR